MHVCVFVRLMFSNGVQNPKRLHFQHQSWAEDGLNVAWLRDGRGSAEFGLSRTGWTWINRVLTGDKGVQKCVIGRLRWRLLVASWYFSNFVCDTSALTPSVPRLRVLLQSVHWASDSLLGSSFNQLNSGCSSRDKFTLSHRCSRFRGRRLYRTSKMYGDKRWAVGKMPLTFLDTGERTTHGTNC